LRTEIVKEFEDMKLNTKMVENGVIDFLGIRMTLFPAEVHPLLSKFLFEGRNYEAGYIIIRLLGEKIASLIFKLSDKFKINSLEEAIHLYAKLATLMGFGEITVQEYDLEKGVIRFRTSNSPICTHFKNSGKNMGAFLEGVIGGVAEFYLGSDSKCKEVKCVAKGDEYCEYLVTFSPEKK
jgi:predicted hydrocarbon binding protein